MRKKEEDQLNEISLKKCTKYWEKWHEKRDSQRANEPVVYMQKTSDFYMEKKLDEEFCKLNRMIGDQKDALDDIIEVS